MTDTEQIDGGFFGTTRKLIRTSLETVQTRVELFAVEVQEERVRLVELLILISATVLLAAVAVVVATITVVWLCGDGARIYVLVGFVVFYAGGAVTLGLNVRHRLKNRPPPFAETVSELKKDIAWVKAQK